MKKLLFALMVFSLVGCEKHEKDKTYNIEKSIGILDSVIEKQDSKETYVSFITKSFHSTSSTLHAAPTPLSNFKLGDSVEYTIKYCSNCFLQNDDYKIIDMKKMN